VQAQRLKKEGHAAKLKQRNGCVWKLSKKKHYGVRSFEASERRRRRAEEEKAAWLRHDEKQKAAAARAAAAAIAGMPPAASIISQTVYDMEL